MPNKGGRPAKNTVDFFPHFCKSGKTIAILEHRFGNDGYAFWFKLLEVLGSSEGHSYLADNPINWEFLLAKTRVTNTIALEIIKLLVDLDAIDRDLWVNHKIIWCQNLVNNVSIVYNTRTTPLPEKPSLCTNSSSKPTTTTPFLKENSGILEENHVPQPVIGKTTPHSRVEYSRVEVVEGDRGVGGRGEIPETTTTTTTEENKGNGHKPTEVISDIPCKENAFTKYQNNIGMITPIIADQIKDAIGVYTETWVIDAIAEAVKNEKRNWRYAEAILRRWKQDGRGNKPKTDEVKKKYKYVN